MREYSGNKYHFDSLYLTNGPNYRKPVMKGGHTHNHIYNVCNRITFRGKYRKRLPREDKKRFVENFWANIKLMPDELNKILANKRNRK